MMLRFSAINANLWAAGVIIFGASLPALAEETTGAAGSGHHDPHAAVAAALQTGAPVSAHVDQHHGSGGLPQLDPSSFETQLIWLFLVFTFLYFFFSKKSLPEIRTVVENRHERIQNDLDTAERLKSDADTVRTAYEQGIVKAKSQSSEIFGKTEEEIRQKAEASLKNFSEKAAKKVQQCEAEIADTRNQAMKDMDAIAADLGKSAAEKILGVKIAAAKAA